MTIRQAVQAENRRGKAIMHAAIKAGIPQIGLSFFEQGRPAAEFDRVCASLSGEPGTFGHLAGVGPGRSADDINASISGALRTQSARDLAAAVIAAGAKAGLDRRQGSRA
jgi:thymidine phosphorylase